MADQQELRGSNLEKNPDEWKTGDEPMTGAQASYLKTLSDQANEAFDRSRPVLTGRHQAAGGVRRRAAGGVRRPRAALPR